MNEQETPLVILPHFAPEEVAALEAEHARRELLFKGRGVFDNDEERVRDAIQRGNYWTEQIAHLVRFGFSPDSEEMRHALAQLGDCLHAQGRITEALRIVTEMVPDPERRTQFEATHQAITRDDADSCECPKETVTRVKKEGGEAVETKTPTVQVVGKYPSARHGGRMVDVKRCVLCGDANIGL